MRKMKRLRGWEQNDVTNLLKHTHLVLDEVADWHGLHILHILET